MKRQIQKKKMQAEIDAIVEVQAHDDDAWSAPIQVRRKKSLDVSLSGRLAARVSFLSELHHAKDPASWVLSVLEERLAFEEAAFGNLKQALKPAHTA